MAAPSPALSRLSPSLLRPSGTNLISLSLICSSLTHCFTEISILPASDSRNLCIRASSTNEPDDGIPLAETDSDHRESTIDDQCSSSTPSTAGPERSLFPYRLENGMDVGIYKAILVGQVSQAPVQKKLKSGRTVSLFSIGTGGIRNNAGASEARDLLRILRGAGSSGIVPASIRSPWVELLWSMSNQGQICMLKGIWRPKLMIK